MLRGWFTVSYQPDKQPKWETIRNDLMNRSNPQAQADALEQLVLLSHSETIPPHLLMPVIQYTGTTHNHRVIKLLLLFLENIDTRDNKNEIRAEYVLITDAIRNLLLSPNEYVRCAALRFLYKMNDVDILQQLLSPILQNLEHNNESVRWHTAHLISRLSRDFPNFSNDFSDSVFESFLKETDQQTLSSLLLACFESSPKESLDQSINLNQIYSNDMKLGILKIANKAYHSFPQFRVRLLEIIVDFCEDDNVSVRLQAANVLRLLSNNPAALRTTATAYCDLLTLLNDENQRAFVVQCLIEMITNHKEHLSPLTLEIAQGINISGPLRSRLLKELVLMVLKDLAIPLVPLITSKDKDSLEALRVLLLRFPETSIVIAEQIGLFISDPQTDISETSSILLKDCGIAGAKKEAFKYFTNSLELCTNPSVLSRIIWSIGEFSDDPNIAAEVLIDQTNNSQLQTNTITIINQDGTYSTKQNNQSGKTFKTLLSEGDSFLSLILISTLVKLKLKGASLSNINNIMDKILSFKGVEKNAIDICKLWIKLSENSNLINLLNDSTNNSLNNRISNLLNNSNKSNKSIIPATKPLHFEVLYNTVEPSQIEEIKTITLPIIQLTGPSDSLYVETKCTLRKFDRIYHFTLYNRTESTLTNILFEFTTIGSVSILQRNDVISITPWGSSSFDLPVMISSGSCGTLFGAVSFDFAGASGSDHQLLPLAPIDINPFYCFEPTKISESQFRTKWAESVWERKIDICINNKDLISYINKLANDYKFEIITPKNQLEITSKNAGFIAANLFTKSLFDEEVEMNVSAKIENEKIIGFIRIRSPDMQLAFLFGKLIQ